jgi:DNA-binding transcriptional LysR family regulator
MDWDDLRFVLALSRHGTLSLAAESLGVSHTTVGRRLRGIEEKLAVRVFDRTPDAFVLTAAGQDVADVAERLEAEVMSLEGRVLGRDTELHGALRVATLDLVFRRHTELFSSFLTRYPSVALTLTSSDDEVSLTRREADVVVRMTNTPPDYLVGRKVGRVDFAVYGQKALVERVGADAPYDAFPWIAWDERLHAMRWLDAWLAQNAPSARVVLRVGFSSLLMHQAIAAGLGVHFLACFDGDADPELQRIGPVASDYSRGLWLLTLPDLRSNSRVQAFMEHADQHFRARRADGE